MTTTPEAHTAPETPLTPADVIARGRDAVDAAVRRITRDYDEDNNLAGRGQVLPVPLLAVLGELATITDILGDLHAALEEGVDIYGDLGAVLR